MSEFSGRGDEEITLDDEIELIDETEEVINSVEDLEINDEFSEFDESIDDDEIDLDDEIPVTLNEEELKLISGTTINENQLSTEDKKIIKQEARNRLIKSSRNYAQESNTKAYGLISTNTIQALRRSTYSEDIRKIGNEILKDAPPFINLSQATQVRKSLSRYNGTIESAREIFNELGLPKQDSSIINLHIFQKYIDRCKKNKNLSETESKMIASQNTSTTIRFAGSMFKGQEMASPEFLNSIKDYQSELVEHIVLGGNEIVFSCGNCGCETKIPGFLVSLVKNPEIMTIVTPLLCTNCNTVNLIPNKNLKKLVSLLREKIYSMQRVQEVKDLDSTLMYYPSNEELQAAMPDLIDFCNSSIEKDEKIIFDWKTMCLDWMKNLEVIHNSKVNYSEDSLGIKNLVKILSSQANDYIEIKENAVASLIQELRTSPLNVLSETYRNMISIPTYYKDKLGKYSDLIARSIASSSIEEKEDGSFEINKKQLESDFDDFEKYVERTEILFKKYVEDLESNKYLFANISISNIRLSKEDIDDYLSDKNLSMVIDEISDLMIIANLSEDYIKYFRPRKEVNGEPQRDASYDTALRYIKDVNKLGKIEKNINNFCKFFTSKIGFKPEILEPNNYSLNFSTDYNFYQSLSRFAKMLLIGDYYEAMKVKNALIVKYHTVLNEMLKNDRYSSIANIVIKLPTTELTDNKYDFYFADYGFSEDEKITIVEIFNKKKIAPMDLIGKDFQEKCKYYTELDDFAGIDIFRIEYLDTFIELNTPLLLGMTYLGSGINFKDFLLYSLSRDFMISLSKLTIDEICKCLFINKDICGMYLSENFNMPKGKFDIGKLIIYLYFSDRSIYTELYDDKNSLTDLRAILDSEKDVMLGEVEGLEVPTRIVNSFFED